MKHNGTIEKNSIKGILISAVGTLVEIGEEMSERDKQNLNV